VTGALKLSNATSANKMAVSYWMYNLGDSGAPAANIDNSAFRVVSDLGGSNGARGFQAHSPWSNGTFYFDHGGNCCGGANRLTTNVGTSLLNGWRHVVVQVDNGSKEIWIDGVLKNSQASGAAAVPTWTNQILIGRDDVNYFRGLIDEFAVWSDTLTQTQIESLAAGTSTADLIGIPEPSTLALASFGLLGVIGFGRRRRR
jgi:hypothetical protein